MTQVPAIDTSARPLRVLHLVSSGTEGNANVSGMLLPLLVRGDRRKVQNQVVYFAPGHPHAAVLRQGGIPVHELKLSQRRGSLLAPAELMKLARAFKPDVVHAWGYSAQIASVLLVKVNKAKPRLVWSMTGTDALPANSGQIAQLKLKTAIRFAREADEIVYSSEMALTRHRRAGFVHPQSTVIAPGVDVERYKPDFAARKRVREQLELPVNAFVIGMQAPFQAEYDHITFFKAVGDIIRANPHTQILLAGRGIQRGNAPLMALVGGGTLATRVRLLGEWSDSAALFNACDVVCSTSLNDEMRMTLAMAMLCGITCVATGMGAQGEVVGNYGVSVEPGSQASLTRGITRVMEMPPERRAFLARGSRQHALANFNLLRSLQRLHDLYAGSATAAASVPERAKTGVAASSADQLTAA